MEKNQIGNCKKMNLLDIHKLIKFILETGIRGGDLPVCYGSWRTATDAVIKGGNPWEHHPHPGLPWAAEAIRLSDVDFDLDEDFNGSTTVRPGQNS